MQTKPIYYCLVLLSIVVVPYDHASTKPGVPHLDVISFSFLEKSEVHGVGVYEPLASQFSVKDVTDWPQLINALRGRKGASQHVWDCLDDATRAEVSNEKLDGMLTAGSQPKEVVLLKIHLASNLRGMIEKLDFYSEKVYATIKLSQEMQELIKLADNRTAYQTLRLNRALLAATFPGAIAEMPQKYHQAHIKVKKGVSITLVLSSYHTCRWFIDIEKGADVKQVILCGYYAQEVTGTDAPLIYMARHDVYGKPTNDKAFNAYKVNTEQYENLRREIKNLTGQDYTSFQGQYRSNDMPFVISPSQ